MTIMGDGYYIKAFVHKHGALSSDPSTYVILAPVGVRDVMQVAKVDSSY